MSRLVCCLLVLLLSSSYLAAQEPEMIRSGAIRWADVPLAEGQAYAEKLVQRSSTVHFEELQAVACVLAPGKAASELAPLADLEETVIVKTGELFVTIKDQSDNLGPASIVITLPGDERKYENRGTVPVTFWSLRYRSKAGANPVRGADAGGSFFKNVARLTFRPSERGGGTDYFRRPTTMCSYFEMHTTTLKPSIPSHAPHQHVNEEIILNVKGRIETTVADVPAMLNPGDFTFVVSNEMHGIKNASEEECTYFAYQWR